MTEHSLAFASAAELARLDTFAKLIGLAFQVVDDVLDDANFVANMNNGKAAGVYMAAYHYAFPADSTPEVQADYFWNLAGPYIKADGKSLMPMLDMEVWEGHLGATSYTNWANKWCNRVIAAAAPGRNACGVSSSAAMAARRLDALL